MSRALTLTLSLALLALSGAGGGVAPDRGDDARLVRLRRDLELIESLVDGGLALSREDDPLQRARQCNALAEQLAHELGLATEKKEAARIVEMGELLRRVLTRGVADNLEMASMEAREGPRGKEIVHVADRVANVETTLKKVYEALDDRGAKESMLPALEGLSKAREEVEWAAKGKGRGKDKSKDKGKGKKKF